MSVFGQVSETRLVQIWAKTLIRIPAGYGVLSDRGFYQCALFYPGFNPHYTPHFLSGRDQFTSEEVGSDRIVCQLRCTSEVAFSRVTTTSGGLRDVIRREFFNIMDDMNDWAHANINLGSPMQKPANY